MQTKHTPGPWGYDPADGTIYYDDNDVRPAIGEVYLEVTDPDQILADGWLIAAAPDMLAALNAWRELERDGYMSGFDFPSCRAASEMRDAAIAKATGGKL